MSVMTAVDVRVGDRDAVGRLAGLPVGADRELLCPGLEC
jgi:hypothetical protein